MTNKRISQRVLLGEKVGEGVVGGAEEAIERIAGSLAERFGLGLALFGTRLLGHERRRHADKHERRHGGIAVGPDQSPVDAEIFEISDEGDGARRRHQHADAIGGDEIGHAGGLRIGRQIFDAEGVDDDVLRCRGCGHEQCCERDHQRRPHRILEAEEQDRRDEQKLGENEPAAAMAERLAQDRHLEGVDDRRPQEFDGVGDADQREQPDGLEVDADILHPQEQRRG